MEADIGVTDTEPGQESSDGGHVGEPSKHLSCAVGHGQVPQ